MFSDVEPGTSDEEAKNEDDDGTRSDQGNNFIDIEVNLERGKY
jgi:hypothetical protein